MSALQYNTPLAAFSIVLALQGEVAGECGEDGAVYDQVMEKLRQDIETNFECVSFPLLT